jgi:acetyl-CoA synthetase
MAPEKLHYLTPHEVAKHLRVETKTVHTWLQEGTMDGVKLGRLRRIPRSQLEHADDNCFTQNSRLLNIKEIPRNMSDYGKVKEEWNNEVPEYFNFGYDVIDAWAKEDRNKLAMIWVNQQGEEKKYTFRDMMKLSTRRQISLSNTGK